MMHTPALQQNCITAPQAVVASASASLPQLPPPPAPSADPGLKATAALEPDEQSAVLRQGNLDIFSLSASVAMKMLCTAVESLVRTTGDVPPTPPIPQASALNMLNSRVLKESTSLDKGETPCRSRRATRGSEDADGVPKQAKTPIGSPEACPLEALHVVGAKMEPLHIQHGVISRKFYSKQPPPIPLEEYLTRLHRYCPMSTAVYLATSLYVHRLAVVERILPVTPRNVHRLLLAGLRVAMKALEDCSYPHRRFAKVGGISETELGRLEISFCFVTNFDLKVDEEMLLRHAHILRDGHFLRTLQPGFELKLPALKDTQRASQILPAREVVREAHAAA